MLQTQNSYVKNNNKHKNIEIWSKNFLLYSPFETQKNHKLELMSHCMIYVVNK